MPTSPLCAVVTFLVLVPSWDSPNPSSLNLCSYFCVHSWITYCAPSTSILLLGSSNIIKRAQFANIKFSFLSRPSCVSIAGSCLVCPAGVKPRPSSPFYYRGDEHVSGGLPQSECGGDSRADARGGSLGCLQWNKLFARVVVNAQPERAPHSWDTLYF